MTLFARLAAVAVFCIAGATAALAQIPAGADRPATVPAGYVITPFGYFHPSCVGHLADGDVVQSDQRAVRHADGTASPISACLYPHYQADGKVASGTARSTVKPNITGWIESVSYTATSAFSALSAEWSVPNSPTARDGQTLFYFPGLENVVEAPTILQPVLGWNSDFSNAWGIASWNCCTKGTVYEAVAKHVSPGDTIQGSVSCAVKGNPCRFWNITTTDLQNGESSQMPKAPSLGQVFTWAFGGVLEVYKVRQCTDFPNNDLISFYNIRLFDLQGRLIANPDWIVSAAPGSLKPQCGYSANLPAQIVLGAVR